MRRLYRFRGAGVVGAMVIVAGALAACGGASAKSAATPSPTSASGRAAGFGNRRLPAALQTSIAEGTRVPFRGTPNAALQTSIAEGTPPPFRGTPNPARETAIAEGTPVPGFGIGRGGRLLGELTTILNETQDQLQTELQVPGATIASVANAHGMPRDAVRQALIDATKQRFDQMVQSGSLTQAQADQSVSQFESSVDGLLDSNGGGNFGGPPPPAGQ